jgi:hypothetical protein
MEHHGINLAMFIEHLLGFYMLVISISMLIYRKKWIDCVYGIGSREKNILTYGMVELLIGLLLVLAHNHWSYSYQVLATIFSWIILIEGLFCLLVPKLMLKFIRHAHQTAFLEKAMTAGAIILLLMGGFILMNIYHFI